MTQATKYYFASDFHLGIDAALSSKERERLIVAWLDEILPDAKEIYFLGDIFDHWFEYAQVVPKGFNLFLGKLAQICLQGIPVYFFTGNHDMWMFGYFEKEFGIRIIREPLQKKIEGKWFYLRHGHGLPTDSIGDKLMKKAFSNPILKWLYARLHPNLGIFLMKYFSHKSRLSHIYEDRIFRPEKERMSRFAEMLSRKNRDLDYIIMGHRHLPIDMLLENRRTRYINLGDWVFHFSYGIFDGNELKIKFFKDEHHTYP